MTNKEYRVDTFIGKDHKKTYFDSKEEALIFAGVEEAKEEYSSNAEYIGLK